MNGKGSRPRTVDMDKYDRNYDAIFRRDEQHDMTPYEIADYIAETADKCWCERLPRGTYALDGTVCVGCHFYTTGAKTLAQAVQLWNKHQRGEE
jgi:hypothetical protein